MNHICFGCRSLSLKLSTIFLSAVVILFLLGGVAGCVPSQVYSASLQNNISLSPGDLEADGLAFITPSTVTGQEEDTQMLALTFADVLGKLRPGIRQVKLSETLSAINRNSYSVKYKKMYDDYRDTGIFVSETLEEVSKLTGSRYLVQLKLSAFQQGSSGRWGALGVRITQTKSANIRLFMQIWDGLNGSIVWEGSEEFNYAYDTGAERPITFKAIIEKSAANLISGLPDGEIRSNAMAD